MLFKTVILTPNPKLPGGVSNYYSVAKKHFSPEVKYVYFNSKYKKGGLKVIVNILMLLKVLCIITFCFPKRIVVNPSLGKTAIIRDGLFLIWAHIFLKKTIVFWRGWDPMKESIFNKKFFKFLLEKAYLKANKHLVLNKYIKSRLVAFGLKRENIFFTNTIVDDSVLNVKAIPSKNSNFIVLFLTRVEKYKGIYEVLQIIEALNLRDLDIEFHIAGDGSELENIKDLVHNESFDNIKFLGYVKGEEKIKTLINSDVYLFPSYSEGMPNSVLEAMGAGLPIVCTRVGALDDFFENEKMGYIHSLPINVKQFEESILKLYSNKLLKEDISNYNKAYAKEHFLASESIKRLEKLIDN